MANLKDKRVPSGKPKGRPPKKNQSQVKEPAVLTEVDAAEPRPRTKPRRAFGKTVPVDPVPAPTSGVPDLILAAAAVASTPASTEANSTGDSAEVEEQVASAAQSLLGKSGSVRKQRATSHLSDADEDDSSGSSGEESDSTTAIEISFDIPIDGASDTVKIRSDVTWTEFLEVIVETMDIRPSEVDDLNLAYRFTTWPKSQRPSVLTKASHLSNLFDLARTDLENPKTKNKDKFKVILENRSTTKGKKGQETSKTKGKSKSKSNSKGRKGEDDEDGAESDDGVVRKKSDADYVKILQQEHACKEHDGQPCIKLSEDNHYVLSKQSLGLWAMLLANGYHQSITIPPKQLKIEDDMAARTARKGRSSSEQAAAPTVPYGYPFPPQLPANFIFPYMPYAPPPMMLEPEASQSRRSLSRRREQLDISSDGFDIDDNPVLFPTVRQWLEDLDASTRNVDNLNFTQYATILDTNYYQRINQIADEGASPEATSTFARDCKIPIGVAKLLVKYAVKDCERIEARERKKRKTST